MSSKSPGSGSYILHHSFMLFLKEKKMLKDNKKETDKYLKRLERASADVLFNSVRARIFVV